MDEKKGAFSFAAGDLRTPEKAMETIRHFILNPKEAASISTSMPHASICRRSQFLPCSYHGVNGRLVQPGFDRSTKVAIVSISLSIRFGSGFSEKPPMINTSAAFSDASPSRTAHLPADR